MLKKTLMLLGVAFALLGCGGPVMGQPTRTDADNAKAAMAAEKATMGLKGTALVAGIQSNVAYHEELTLRFAEIQGELLPELADNIGDLLLDAYIKIQQSGAQAEDGIVDAVAGETFELGADIDYLDDKWAEAIQGYNAAKTCYMDAEDHYDAGLILHDEAYNLLTEAEALIFNAGG